MLRGGDRSELPGYGELKRCARGGRGTDAAQTDGGSDQRPEVGAGRADCSVTQWARDGINPAQGKSVRYRRWMLKGRRIVVATRND